MICERWGSEFVVVHGTSYYPHELPGFIAVNDEASDLGVVTYSIERLACELVTLDSIQQGIGIGTALLEEVVHEASKRGCRRVWCITTNDNLPALQFYQKRGFRIVTVYPGVVEHSRVLKPSIPHHGINNIPIRDEIELELNLKKGG